MKFVLIGLQTDDRIYLILEFCDGGDLWGYINRHGKVSEAVARDLMRQLGMLLLCFQWVCFVWDYMQSARVSYMLYLPCGD